MVAAASPCVDKPNTPSKTADNTLEKAVEVPVIDLQEIKSEESYAKLRQVCKEWGCFRAVDHGFPIYLMAEMKATAKELFDLPMEVKMRIREANPGEGYMPPHDSYILEGLGVFGFGSLDVVNNLCSKLDATPHQREIMTAYSKEITKLSSDILSKIATSFGVTDYSFESWSHQFRMNKYSFTQDTIGSTGVFNHTDAAFLTVLQEDECHRGLEVRSPSGTFIAVDPVPNTFVLNLGDLAVPWSNGQMRNVEHRVVCKDAGARISIATFVAPELHQVFEAPPKILEADHVAQYVPFTYGGYRRMRHAEKKFVGENLEKIRRTDQCA